MKRTLALLVLAAATLLPAAVGSADPTSEPSAVEADRSVEVAGDAPSGEQIYYGCYNGFVFWVDIQTNGWQLLNAYPSAMCAGENFMRRSIEIE